MKARFQSGDALFLVDVQRDFCPGGSLAVEEGDRIVPILNEWIEEAVRSNTPVIASRDWHPPDHVSFKERGGPWPRHCVRETDGAAFHPSLILPPSARIVDKGTRDDRDEYSAFQAFDLAGELRARNIRRLWMGGLAQDVCVRQTALDARKEGFDVHTIPGASRPVKADGGRKALDEMRDAGVVVEGGDG